jgi:hypothetical protein
VPLAALILIFDAFGLTGLPLLGGGAPRRIERFGVGREALRKDAVDSVGPAIIVADDFVCNVCHESRLTSTLPYSVLLRWVAPALRPYLRLACLRLRSNWPRV